MTDSQPRLYPYRWTPPLDVLAEVDRIARARHLSRAETILQLLRSGLAWAEAEHDTEIRLGEDF